MNGEPLLSSPAFLALRDNVPTTNPKIESMRARHEEIFELLESKGFTRDSLVLAWDFMVASKEHILGPVLSMREEALATVATDGVQYTLDNVVDEPNENLARSVEGTFSVPCWLNEQDLIEFDELGRPVRQANRSFPFTMIIPRAALEGEPLPVGLFGHGIFGTGRNYLVGGLGVDHIQPLAQEIGAVVIATDWIGLSGGDLDLIIREVVPDLNRLRLVTDRLVQSLINNLVLIELVKGAFAEDPQLMVTESRLVDSERIHYYGASLGGIQGASLVSLSRDIRRAALGVPGASWSNMLPRSIVYQPIRAIVDLRYPDPLIQQIFIAMMQVLFDHSDPINVSKLMYAEPLDDAPTERVVVLQEAVGDCQVPNPSTRMLARAVGARQMAPFVEPVFGLEEVEGPTTLPVLWQVLMPDRVEAYRPPLTNVLPAEDNDVHFRANLLPATLAQLIHLLEEGEIEQYCEGPCDPD